MSTETTDTASEQQADPRSVRYSKLLPVQELAGAHVAIVGVGAIGRQVAVSLASMGVNQFTLIDPDTVEEANLGTQGWHVADVDDPKVDAASAAIGDVNPDAEAVTTVGRFRASKASTNWDVVFLCVDCMDARKLVVNTVDWCPVIDCRMGAEQADIHVVADADSREVWMNGWFSNADASPEDCTARSTFYCAAIAAGMAVNAWTRLLREMLVPMSVSYVINADTTVISDRGVSAFTPTEPATGDGAANPNEAGVIDDHWVGDEDDEEDEDDRDE